MCSFYYNKTNIIVDYYSIAIISRLFEIPVSPSFPSSCFSEIFDFFTAVFFVHVKFHSGNYRPREEVAKWYLSYAGLRKITMLSEPRSSGNELLLDLARLLCLNDLSTRLPKVEPPSDLLQLGLTP